MFVCLDRYLKCPDPGHNGQNDVDEGLSDPYLFANEIVGDHPATRPRVDHARAPDELPAHRPDGARHARDRLARPPLPLSFQDGREADHDEEPARVRKLGAAPEAPEAPDVHDARDEVGAHDRAPPACDLASRARAVHDEEVAEELVPSPAPKLGHGSGHPGPVGDARPLRGRLAEDDLPKERADLVHDVDGGVDDDHAAEGDAGHDEQPRREVEGVVEDGVALEAVRGRTEELDEVVRGVERRDFAQEFEELLGKCRWWVGAARERIG